MLLAERTDAAKGELLRAWLDDSVVPAFVERILPVDLDVAVRAAGLHVPDPAPVRDSLIGATALVHGMIVVTRNTRDFERFPNLEIVNPWTGQLVPENGGTCCAMLTGRCCGEPRASSTQSQTGRAENTHFAQRDPTRLK